MELGDGCVEAVLVGRVFAPALAFVMGAAIALGRPSYGTA
jgi:hypothetical protein